MAKVKKNVVLTATVAGVIAAMAGTATANAETIDANELNSAGAEAVAEPENTAPSSIEEAEKVYENAKTDVEAAAGDAMRI